MAAATFRRRTAYNKLTSLVGCSNLHCGSGSNHNAFQMAAALAYYTLVSLAPLIIILIAIVGPFFGTAATENYIVGAIAGIAGEESARAVQAIVQNANQHGSGVLASVVGVVLLLLGAGAVVGQLQQSLNVIFGVTPEAGHGLVGFHSRAIFLLCDASSHWFSSAGIAYCHDRSIGDQQILRRSYCPALPRSGRQST